MDCLFQTCAAVVSRQLNIPGLTDSNRSAASLVDTNPEGASRGNAAMRQPEPEHIPNSGRKKALLIGCNYRGTKAELRGCLNDVNNLKEMLMTVYSFRADDIVSMTDDDYGDLLPTRSNVTRACRELVAGAQPGDVFFFSYSGHGGQQDDTEGFEEDGMNETLIPLDYQEVGMIADDELNRILVEPLPSGCKLTVFFDACHSGTGLDLPYRLSANGWIEAVNPLLSQADVCMISGCMDEQTSADAMIQGSATGALTHSLLEVLGNGASGRTYVDLLQESHSILDRGNYTQRPVFTSNQPFNISRPFSFDIICPNKNQKLGRIDRNRFKPGSAPNPNVLAFMQEIQVGGLEQVAKIGMGLVSAYMAKQSMGNSGSSGGGLGALAGMMGGGGNMMSMMSGMMGGSGGGNQTDAFSSLLGGKIPSGALAGIGMPMFKKFLLQEG